MNKIKTIALVILTAAVLAFALFGGEIRIGGRSDHELPPVRDTVFDTITIEMPVPKDSTVVRYIVRTLPVADYPKDSNSLQIGKDFGDETDSVTKADSAKVALPITRKVYEDSTYRAIVSGYEPSLDELTIYNRTIREVEVQREKLRRWSIGIQGGYGMTPKGFQPYIGVGVTYRIW